MRHEAQPTMRLRFCRRAECRAMFFICQACDRGQRYCGADCRRLARQSQRREASRRYTQSREGRFNHRLNQRAYRRRLATRRVAAANIARVTDHSSRPASPVVKSTGAITILRQVQAFWLPLMLLAALQRSHTPVCRCCSRQGQFVEIG